MTDRPESGAPWLRLEGVSFFHGRKAALEEVSLEFYPGRHYILAGPNGAGKSTLLDLLSGLKKPGDGRLTVMGRAPGDWRPMELARRLALAPQDFRLNFSFTVREVVGMGRRPYLGRFGALGPEDEAAVDRALESMDLAALSGRPVTALSGGEKQRVVAARALAQATPVLLLDEPSAGLDVAHALALMDLVRRLAEEENRLVVTVTHDLNLAAAFGHEFVFLKRGRLLAAGPRAEIFNGRVLAEAYSAEGRDVAAEVLPNDFSGGPVALFKLKGA